MTIKLSLNDQISTSKGCSTVTRLTKDSVWLDGKRYGLEATIKDIQSIIYAISPETKVDWTNKKAVTDFYHSFKRWSFYISGGCKYTTEICEVKNGMLFHNGEYYVPAPKGTYDDWCTKDFTDIKDGLYYVNLYKRVSSYYNHQGGEIRNVFYIKEVTSLQEQESLKIRKEWNYHSTPLEQSVAHIKSLNIQKILSKELDFIKSNMLEFFKEHLPFKASNGVYINKWESFKNPLACSKGLLYFDNCYHGHNPSGLDHGLMFKFHPSFTNEAGYYASSRIAEFSPMALEQIAIQIKKSVDSYCKL